jgi:hypothetical protein
MATNTSKLGKILGSVGAGLSVIPGPWSAVGIALAAAGTVTTKVGEAKDRKAVSREEEQAQREAEMNQPFEAQEVEDPARPGQGQATTGQPNTAQRGVMQPGGFKPNLGNYQLQMDQEIANMLTQGGGGLYGD